VKVVLPVTAVILALLAQPAAAAFRGTNGPIAFEQSGSAIGAINGDKTGLRSNLVAVGPADRDPSWAPDGRHLAFTSTRDGNEEIYVLDMDSGAQTRVTVDAARDHDPSWSPDGASIVFASERDGNSEIYTMPAAGGAARRLTFTAADDRQPAWSGRGVIAFASDRGGDFDLWVMDGTGGGLTRLTTGPGSDLDPSWAPDGTALAYTHAENGFSIRTIDAEGEHDVQLTSPGQYPAWSPDGTEIAFAEPTLQVIPSRGGPARTLGIGTDPNWGPVPAPVRPPEFARTLTIAPVAANVFISPAVNPTPQTRLRTPGEFPVGTTIDASHGTVGIDAVTLTPDGPGTVGHASVTGGIFVVAQDPAPGSEPTLQLKRSFRPCGGARAARIPDPDARMRVRVRGRFRSVGGYGSAAGRGTYWMLHDRCDGTTIKVYEGLVLVHDNLRNLDLVIRAGRCYLASATPRDDALRSHRQCPPVRRP
jgi:hypothetical protein